MTYIVSSGALNSTHSLQYSGYITLPWNCHSSVTTLAEENIRKPVQLRLAVGDIVSREMKQPEHAIGDSMHEGDGTRSNVQVCHSD